MSLNKCIYMYNKIERIDINLIQVSPRGILTIYS